MTHFGKLYGRKVIWRFLSFFTPAMIQPCFVHDTVHRRGESSNSAVGVPALIRLANLAFNTGCLRFSVALSKPDLTQVALKEVVKEGADRRDGGEARHFVPTRRDRRF